MIYRNSDTQGITYLKDDFCKTDADYTPSFLLTNQNPKAFKDLKCVALMLNSNGENFDYALSLPFGGYVVAGALVLLISMLVSFLFSKRIRTLDMVDVLKGTEQKGLDVFSENNYNNRSVKQTFIRFGVKDGPRRV